MSRERKAPVDIEGVYVAHAERLRLVGARAGSQEAPDVVHEAVANVLEAQRRSALRDPLRFMLKAVKNTALSRLRERQRRPIPAELDGRSLEDPQPDAERTLQASERLSRALTIIEAMPDRRRQAFTLHRFDELSYVQIARRMGISVKAVEKHISQAMAQLHREMEDQQVG